MESTDNKIETQTTEHIITKLKFVKSERNGALISFVSRNPVNGVVCGVREDSPYPKKIVRPQLTRNVNAGAVYFRADFAWFWRSIAAIAYFWSREPFGVAAIAYFWSREPFGVTAINYFWSREPFGVTAINYFWSREPFGVAGYVTENQAKYVEKTPVLPNIFL